MKRFLFILLSFAFTLSVLAAEITGKVIDFGTKQPIDFANVSVLKSIDGVPVTGAVSDADGNFSIEVADGKYIVVVSFMGYTEQKKEVTVAGKPVNLGRIQLREDALT